ncbi:MAG: hypothetical protein E7426_02755 [Ruminococcaceae bacterium]|nr:hypothetical protein [Oscillospiraceae bacterium]
MFFRKKYGGRSAFESLLPPPCRRAVVNMSKGRRENLFTGKKKPQNSEKAKKRRLQPERIVIG